ncbi:hypothetical protein F2P56_019509 [Juglans regia]|uniref:Uncharacterized protein n=2 Tax=Juglans regia TaxID=51240 RepID=A0A833UUL3_JUGRE|nr:uncharacterized protein LOC109003056 [Juglans regia]KAF5459570.1 hypothetical protein F2P56_019509 [Juglans regia]
MHISMNCTKSTKNMDRMRRPCVVGHPWWRNLFGSCFVRGGQARHSRNICLKFQLQEKSRRNMSNRQKLKVNHTGGRKSFVRILEEKNIMVKRLNEKDPEEDYDEAAANIFKDVLGFKSGYAQGMGHMVISDPSPSMKKNKALCI